MFHFGLCGLFSGSKRNEQHKSCDEALDAINFPALLEDTGPRKQKSLETMQSIVDRLHNVLDTLSLLSKFRYEVEDLRETEPGPEASPAEHDDRRLQDAINLSALVVAYWEEEGISDSPTATDERPSMEEASRIMGELIEGIQDEVFEVWDSVTKINVHRVRLWLRMGGHDQLAPYAECYVTEDPKDGASDGNAAINQPDRLFPCNQCPEVFDIAVQLEDHLRQNHERRGMAKWLGETFRTTVFGGFTRTGRPKGKGENEQAEEPVHQGDNEAAQASSVPLAESWLEVAPVLDNLPQPVQCPKCSNTYTSVSAFRSHCKIEHDEDKRPEFSTDPRAVNPEVPGKVAEVEGK
jgi:hypothetical protein